MKKALSSFRLRHCLVLSLVIVVSSSLFALADLEFRSGGWNPPTATELPSEHGLIPAFIWRFSFPAEADKANGQSAAMAVYIPSKELCWVGYEYENPLFFLFQNKIYAVTMINKSLYFFAASKQLTALEGEHQIDTLLDGKFYRGGSNGILGLQEIAVPMRTVFHQFPPTSLPKLNADPARQLTRVEVATDTVTVVLATTGADHPDVCVVFNDSFHTVRASVGDLTIQLH